jgi:hypothetical protein
MPACPKYHLYPRTLPCHPLAHRVAATDLCGLRFRGAFPDSFLIINTGLSAAYGSLLVPYRPAKPESFDSAPGWLLHVARLNNSASTVVIFAIWQHRELAFHHSTTSYLRPHAPPGTCLRRPFACYHRPSLSSADPTLSYEPRLRCADIGARLDSIRNRT